MRGYCKCDLCGKTYHKDDNKEYEGITVWYLDNDGDTIYGQDEVMLGDINGIMMIDKIPARMDVCPDCFKKFCNWIKTIKEETK